MALSAACALVRHFTWHGTRPGRSPDAPGDRVGRPRPAARGAARLGPSTSRNADMPDACTSEWLRTSVHTCAGSSSRKCCRLLMRFGSSLQPFVRRPTRDRSALDCQDGSGSSILGFATEPVRSQKRFEREFQDRRPSFQGKQRTHQKFQKQKRSESTTPTTSTWAPVLHRQGMAARAASRSRRWMSAPASASPLFGHGAQGAAPRIRLIRPGRIDMTACTRLAGACAAMTSASARCSRTTFREMDVRCGSISSNSAASRSMTCACSSTTLTLTTRRSSTLLATSSTRSSSSSASSTASTPNAQLLNTPLGPQDLRQRPPFFALGK